MLIPKNVFSVSKCSGKDAGRWAVNAVKLERDDAGRPWAVATDGSCLLAATWHELPGADFPGTQGNREHVPSFEASVPVCDWNEAAKHVPGRGNVERMRQALVDEPTATADRVDLIATDADRTRLVQAKPNGLSFPKWRQVVPKYEIMDATSDRTHAVRIGVNPRLLARVLEAMAATAPCDGTPWVDLIVPLNPQAPLLLRTVDRSGVEASAVVMPMTIKDADRKGVHSAAPALKAEVAPEPETAQELQAVPAASETVDSVPPAPPSDLAERRKAAARKAVETRRRRMAEQAAVAAG